MKSVISRGWRLSRIVGAIQVDEKVSHFLLDGCEKTLSSRVTKLRLWSSVSDFSFIFSFVIFAVVFYNYNTIDLLIAAFFLTTSLLINVWLPFKYISEILPIEAHIYGIKGIPYELDIKY